ncbi:MAG: AtpZ/AtpI family protein [Candidatus Hydrothermarchaeota archaeon]
MRKTIQAMTFGVKLALSSILFGFIGYLIGKKFGTTWSTIGFICGFFAGFFTNIYAVIREFSKE